MAKVYCIIVTFNGDKWIEKCLSSLVNSDVSTNTQLTVICIDNGSTDLTLSIIRERFPSIHLNTTGKNLGFGQANNIGFIAAIQNKADYVFLLNQDAWVEKNTIANLVNIQQKNPGFGIISPVHLNGDGTGLDLYFKNYLLKSALPANTVPENIAKANSNLLINTEFVNAAAWLISIDCLKKTGGFDPLFFHYGEDQNFAQRAIHSSYQVGIFAGCKIYHDREDRILASAKGTYPDIKKEWVQFLVYACDINRSKFGSFIGRRFLKYSLLSVKNIFLFNKEAFSFNYRMAKRIISSFLKIKKSRERAFVNGIYLT